MSWFLYEIQSKVSQSKISCSKSIQAKPKQCAKSVIVNLNRFRNLFFFNVDFQQEDAGWVYVSYYNTSILRCLVQKLQKTRFSNIKNVRELSSVISKII